VIDDRKTSYIEVVCMLRRCSLRIPAAGNAMNKLREGSTSKLDTEPKLTRDFGIYLFMLPAPGPVGEQKKSKVRKCVPALSPIPSMRWSGRFPHHSMDDYARRVGGASRAQWRWSLAFHMLFFPVHLPPYFPSLSCLSSSQGRSPQRLRRISTGVEDI
jgi:hypothetical protein